MFRKGYVGEYIVKKKLIEEFGKINVTKIAISQDGSDFHVLKKGRLVKVVEVKEKVGDKEYTPDERSKNQFERIKEYAIEHNCLAELWIIYRLGKGKKPVINVRILYKPIRD